LYDGEEFRFVDGLAYNSEDGFLYGTEATSANLLRIDPTETVNVVWESGLYDGEEFRFVDGLAYIPEPATLSLLALGSFVLVRRRKRGELK